MARRNDVKPMSIDAALDMEAQEILALLGNTSQTGTSPQSNRSSSPYATRNPPPRSMLDIDEEPAAPGSPTTRTVPAVQAPVRSMLDFGDPLPPKAKSRGSSPVAAQPGSIPQSRSMSDANLPPADFGPRRSNLSGRNDPTAAYQFNPLPSAAQSMPKRTSQPSTRASQQGSLGEALRGNDLSSMRLPGERGRNPSVDTRLSGQSRSPNGRIASRSRSPAPYSPSFLPRNQAYLNDGTTVDLSGAYRKLSDAHMALRGSSLSHPRKQSDDQSGRLAKSYIGPDGEDLPSSDEDDEEDDDTSDDEVRGRRQNPRPLSPDASRDKGKGKPTSSPVATRGTKSLLAAAEEERKLLETQPKYSYKSLIPEPEIKVTGSSGEAVKVSSKHAVHPHTSYDHGPTATVASAMESDDEADLDEIKRAQKLSFSMTNVISTPESSRSIRIINRGAYTQIAAQEDARQRKYLVATDLSGESAHALEWAIGTVLRDGDTLIAIYCVDEETGIGADEVGAAEDAKTMKEQAAAVNSIASSKSMPSMKPVSDLRRGSMFPSSWRESTGTPGASPAPSPRGERSKAELERQRAVEDITDRVLRLLRKTQLQVRVVVEVLHCKNPKHLITEVIDLVNPTLVVIGSRGRSALKGVILGSFSNYLVTKSSVPVMVARKRLRKQGKYKGKATQRQINNISNPSARSLVNAKID